jgi:hypothetical protein
MTLVVSLFVALSVTVIFYSIGQGGPVAGMIFLGILGIGALIKLTEPLRQQLRA